MAPRSIHRDRPQSASTTGKANGANQDLTIAPRVTTDTRVASPLIIQSPIAEFDYRYYEEEYSANLNAPQPNRLIELQGYTQRVLASQNDAFYSES